MRAKTALLLIFMIALTTSLHAQFLPGDIGYKQQQEKVFKEQKVKTQSEKQYSDEWLAVNTLSEFTKDGKLNRSVYAPDLNVEEAVDTIFYDYDYLPDGNLRSVKIEGPAIGSNAYAYIYATNGQVEKESMTGDDAREFIYTYDKKGNIVLRTGIAQLPLYDESDHETGETVDQQVETYSYAWNDEGFLIGEQLEIDGEFYYYAAYGYDNKGNLLKQAYSYDSVNKKNFSTVIDYVYDKNGLLLKRIFTYPDTGEKFESMYTYTYYK